ncbi:MAG TPA: choice-of-anchor J domain-containing protein [Flavisolibacter sp.]|nr:choice-of-anchor J domain-containing protein [Flavisolibacter sp.]
MRKSTFSVFLLCAVLSTVVLQSCKDDSNLLTPPPIPDQSFVEEFDTMQQAYNRGWRWINRSAPVGTTNWSAAPGPGSFMGAYSSTGTNTGAAFSDYQATGGTTAGIISNWLISPEIFMQNGDKIIFYTRSQITSAAASGRDFSCRLQVRVNPFDGELSMGNGDDAGKFTTLLLDINPNEIEYLNTTRPPAAYPVNWTRFEATVAGLPKIQKGRFAFRYYLHGAGSAGKGNGVGIDSVAYVGRK